MNVKFLKSVFVGAVSLFSLGAFAGNYVLQVKGMTCEGCAQGVTKSLKKVDGVEDVKVDVEKKEVAVQIKQNAKVASDDLKKAVQKAGYKVEKVTAL